jgi:hypothetical protein
MRILVALSPMMYREAIAHIIRANRPNAEVRLAEPEGLDREASSFGPHLIVCSDDPQEFVPGVSVPSWVVIRYQDSMSASVFLDGRDPYLIEDISNEDVLGVIDETQRLVASRRG